METMSYPIFDELNAAEKVEFFDEPISMRLFESDKNKKNFLKTVIENSQNNFLRKKAIDHLVHMVFFQETTKYGTVLSVLEDIEDDDDIFVLTAKIKYLYFLNEKLALNNQSIINQLDNLRFHQNSEISSEANYYMGLHQLFSGNSSTERETFYKSIEHAKLYFKTSYESTENRTDALLLSEICRLICNAFQSISNTKIVKNIKSLILDRKLSYIYQEIPDIELFLYQISLSIHNIASSNPYEWLDIQKEINNLCSLHYELFDRKFSNECLVGVSPFVDRSKKYIVQPLYLISTKQHIGAIKKISADSEDDKVSKFCQYLIGSYESNSEIKKKPEIDVAITLGQVFPNISSQKIEEDLNEINSNDISSLIRLTNQYHVELQQIDFLISVTGNSTGDEIFHSLISKIKTKIPDYPDHKLLDYKIILSDLIRYMLRAASKKRSGQDFFKFLYQSDASENDLQESILAHLEMASGASKRYRSETPEIADGGRVDILFESDNATIPIELKKTDKKPSNDTIKDNYLGQAQTYCYPHDQLGFFVLLDNSSKLEERESPINDIRELFNLVHMKPYYDFDTEIKAPNYIITIVIPGNKVTPSMRSNYI
jgi:hypothetical protein